MFAILILILVFRPQGLLGERTPEGGVADAGAYHPRRRNRPRRWSAAAPLAAGRAAVLIARSASLAGRRSGAARLRVMVVRSRGRRSRSARLERLERDRWQRSASCTSRAAVVIA